MKNRIKLATAGLRISAILYYLIIAFCVAGAIFLKEPEGDLSPGMLWFLAAFTAPFVVFLEVLIVHVRRRRYWAWVAGIVVGGLYASSLFMPLGVMILIGLLSEESRASFGVGACSPGGPPAPPKVV